VRYLDWKVSQINKLINVKRRQIALLQEQKQATINHLVTTGLNPNAKMKKSGIEWIGEIPEAWEIRTLFGVAVEQKYSNKTSRNQNLLSLSYGKIIAKDINITEGLLPLSFDTYQIVNDGNIILRLTDLQNDHKSLRVGLATQTGIITSAYTCLKIREEILPQYIYYLLHSYDICKVFYGMGGGVRQSIGYKDIRKMPILIPTLKEQMDIVNQCDELRDKFDSYVSNSKKQIDFLSEYRVRLISDVVTGKLDVRGVAVPDYAAVELVGSDVGNYGVENDTPDETED
jgi:type I restriction enzyme S subunit